KFHKSGHSALPTYVQIPLFEAMTSDHLHLLTGTVNVHTQARTANCAWLMEINHYNPAWINTKTAENLGIEDGDEIEIESEFGVKRLECRAKLTEGIHPKAIFVQHSLGHFAYGGLATKGKYKEYNYETKEEQSEKEVWYAEEEWPGPGAAKDPKGRDIWAWSPNWIIANDEEHTDPIGGEHAWSDTIVKVRKAGGGE
ncbi:MAG: hypothetical protein HY776_03760, partial [Actinobacteria bacterium]|nr:hypothetical protein [Actinomycetota bacterium]